MGLVIPGGAAAFAGGSRWPRLEALVTVSAARGFEQLRLSRSVGLRPWVHCISSGLVERQAGAACLDAARYRLEIGGALPIHDTRVAVENAERTDAVANGSVASAASVKAQHPAHWRAAGPSARMLLALPLRPGDARLPAWKTARLPEARSREPLS